MRGNEPLFSSLLKGLWYAAVFAAIVSGFGQLPLSPTGALGFLGSGRRISCIYMHYCSAAALLLLGSYICVIWLAWGRLHFALSPLGRARVACMICMVLSGLVLLLHNLPGFSLYGAAYAVVKLGHFFAAVVLLLLTPVHWCLFLLKKGSYTSRRDGAGNRELS